MRSLSSSIAAFRSAFCLRISEARGATAERQRPQQRRFKRRAQRVTLQQENKCRGDDRMQQNVAPVFRHRYDTPGDVAVALHGGSLRVASSAGGFGEGRSSKLAAAPGFFDSASARTGSLGEPAVLVPPPFFSVVSPPIGAENCRPFCGPGFGGLPAAKPSSTLPKLSLVRSS